MPDPNVHTVNDVDPNYNAWLVHEAQGDPELYELILEREDAADAIADLQGAAEPETVEHMKHLFRAVAERKREIGIDDLEMPHLDHKIDS